MAAEAARPAEVSDESATQTFLRRSREQLLEDFALKDSELRACTAQKAASSAPTPWWLRAIVYLTIIVLVIIAVWGIIAVINASKRNKELRDVQAELDSLNSRIAERAQGAR